MAGAQTSYIQPELITTQVSCLQTIKQSPQRMYDDVQIGYSECASVDSRPHASGDFFLTVVIPSPIRTLKRVYIEYTFISLTFWQRFFFPNFSTSCI